MLYLICTVLIVMISKRHVRGHYSQPKASMPINRISCFGSRRKFYASALSLAVEVVL